MDNSVATNPDGNSQLKPNSDLAKSLSPSFCVLPWLQRFINLGGEHQLCCTSEEHRNSIRNTWGRALKITQNISPDQIQNASSLRKVRRQMLKGTWPKACVRCQTVEKCGGKSRRQIENGRFKDDIKNILEQTDPQGRTFLRPTYIDLRLGNYCNLICRMCNPRASQRWVKEWNRVKLKWERYLFIKRRFKYDWYRQDEAKSFLSQLIPEAKILHIAGGEPLIIPETLELLKELEQSGLSSEIEISFNTNLTVLHKDLMLCLQKFKRVFFYISIDAYGSLNDYIRYPSRWDQMVRRVHELSAWAENSPFVVQFNVTVQIYNILRLDQLIDWIQTLQLPGIEAVPNLTVLNNPSYFDIRNLPHPLKKKAAEIISKRKSDWLNRAPDYARQTLSASLDSILEHLKFPTSNPWARSHFFSVTTAMDASRGQNLEDHLPELAAHSFPAPLPPLPPLPPLHGTNT